MSNTKNKSLSKKQQLQKQESELARDQRLAPLIQTTMSEIEARTGLKFRISPFVCRDEIEHPGDELFYMIESTYDTYVENSPRGNAFHARAVHLTIPELYSFVRGYKLALEDGRA